MDKIGLFGGSFDPPHLAHISVAHIAYKQLGLDRVLFIPCRLSPHKEGDLPVSAEHRLKMLNLALQSDHWAEISDIELKREGLSYSVNTVLYYREQYPDAKLYWIMGSDQWEVLDTWHRSEELVEMLEFVVFPRPTPPEAQLGQTMHHIDTRIDMSSSQIRAQISAGEHVAETLHPDVDRYIRHHQLYV